jgi:hypothetical protein
LKRLLDPRYDPPAKTQTLPSLPSFPNAANQPPTGKYPSQQTSTQEQKMPPALAAPAQSRAWVQAPSSIPLPLPDVAKSSSPPSVQGAASSPAQQNANRTPQIAIASATVATRTLQNATQPKPSNQTVAEEPRPRQTANLHTADNKTEAGNQPHSAAKPNASQNLSPYMGKMNVPASEETIASTSSDTDASGAGAAGASAPALNHAAAQPTRAPQTSTPGSPSGTSNSPSNLAPNLEPSLAPNLRIASQPMGPMAAQVQALFANQVDSQLTQGSASVIHSLANPPIGTAAASTAGQLPSLQAASSPIGQYNVAQYTPSAQEAATGAYSAPKQQATPQAASPAPPQCAPQQCPPVPAKPAAKPKKKKANPAIPAGTPTLEQVPQQQQSVAPAPQQAPAPAEVPAPAPATDTGLTDEELQQRNLPPLRGPWIRTQRNGNPISPREEAEMQLRSIESSYSGWLAGPGLINYRSGSMGFDHLAALEAPFEASVPLGYNGRFTVVARPVFLDSGQADGTSTLTVVEQTTAGSSLVSIPQPIGTLINTATTPPAQQNAVGIGGELQLAFPHLALAAGYTPEGFLVATITGRAYWKPGNGPFTFNFSRDPVRDTQLSYAGLRDPSGDTLGNMGQIWGGVVANQGQVQFAKGDAQSGFYVGGGGQYLTGYTVETNNRFDASGGAYWRLKTVPEYGNLSIGINFFGMHYAHNEDAFTHGMGGYFSPQAYFLANVPFTWTAHYGTHWHYNVLGSLGVQAFQQNLTPLFPLAVDKALETALNNAMLPAKTSVGPNYDVRSQVSYQIGPHWFAGGFVSANNARNYTSVSAGFSVHYMFRSQPSTATTPTGIFPTDGLRPFAVP